MKYTDNMINEHNTEKTHENWFNFVNHNGSRRIMMKFELITLAVNNNLAGTALDVILDIYENCNGNGVNALGLFEEELNEKLRESDIEFDRNTSHLGICIGKEGRLSYSFGWESIEDSLYEAIATETSNPNEDLQKIEKIKKLFFDV
jgi:hypothetical protein